MKILETQSATLTNHEVSAHLTDLLSSSRLPSSTSPPNLSAILKDTSAYLTSHSTDSSSPLPPTISGEKIKLLAKELKHKGLEKGEVLMLLNLGPKGEEDLGLLDCVVEEVDERLGEEEQRGLLEVVGRVMYGDDRNGIDGGVDGNGEGGRA